jgi:hypothetical protein
MIIAPEGFQTQQGFIARLTPELSGSFEAALVLPAGSFHRAAANGLAASASSAVIHPVLMLMEIIDFPLHRFSRRATRQLPQPQSLAW